MTSISNSVHIDKLDNIVNKQNNSCHSTIKMKPAYVKSNTYINFSKEINDKDAKLKICDIVRMSKYKNIFARVYIPNWSEEVFVIKEIKNTVPQTHIIIDLNGEEIVGIFHEKEFQKTYQKGFIVEKVINRKGDKIYVKSKGYDSSFNSSINKKDIV